MAVTLVVEKYTLVGFVWQRWRTGAAVAIENKTEVIPVRLTPTQADRVRKLATEQGQRLSEWFREVAKRELAKEE